MGETDWTKKLEEETGFRFRTTKPEEIERESFLMIQEELGEKFLSSYPETQLPVLLRVIHTTADFSYGESLTFTNDAMEAGCSAIRRGLPIITDTTMAASGINKAAAGRFGCQVHCFIGDADVKEEAKKRSMTRAAVSVEKAARLYPDCIYAVGNGPTALMRLYELIREQKIRPALIIGTPVGFVNVARGRKGGSNVAAAICNALFRTVG